MLPSGCYNMADGLWMALIFFGVIVFLIILLIAGNYQKIKHRKRINPIPFITFGICILIIELTMYLQSEKFKSSRILTASDGDNILVLRKNYQYELTRKQPERGCVKVGEYRISNDTIQLKEEPRVDETLIINEKFLIDKIHEKIIPIQNDTINKENSLRIIENYAP